MAKAMVVQKKTYMLHKTVVLVGLMGCGKSSIGKRLAERLDVPFIDSDTEIETKAGCSISEIFATQGEAHFRALEHGTIAGILTKAPCILATGGGAFIQENTRELIRQNAVSIWLNAGFDVLLERVSRKKTRPLLEQGNKAEILKNLMDVRYPIYEKADIMVSSSTGAHSIVVNKVLKALESGHYITEEQE